MKSSHVHQLPKTPSPPLRANIKLQSCSGISFKSQALYMIVYATRYLGSQKTFTPHLQLLGLPTYPSQTSSGTSALYITQASSSSSSPSRPTPSTSCSTTTNQPTTPTSTPSKCNTSSAAAPSSPSYSPTDTRSQKSVSSPIHYRGERSMRDTPYILQHTDCRENNMLTPFSPSTDPLGLQHLPRIRRHPPPTLYAPTHRRSRNDHHTLPLRTRSLSRAVHPELAVQVFRRGVCGSDRLDGWTRADGAVFGFLLDLLYQVS